VFDSAVSYKAMPAYMLWKSNTFWLWEKSIITVSCMVLKI